jgi:hypothetical protein
MRAPSFRLIPTVILAIVATMIGSAFAEELPLCSAEGVIYSPFDKDFAARITVRQLPANTPTPGEKQFSPQRTRWLIVGSSPDYMKLGPWTTVVWLFKSEGGMPQRVSFVDHGSGGVSVQWLNEKLLYGSVWWGRLESTDFIYDAEKKRFLYREMAYYGELVQPCK